MSTDLALVNENSLMMWNDNNSLEEIRKLFAPTLSDTEFKFFVGLGKASRLNPFTREIWAVKYDKNAAAQIFIGRDGYRKAAQSHSEYDYHQSDAVYENDKFEVVNGEVKHAYNLTNRGRLVGAYCIAKRHKSSRPLYVFVEIGEYSTGRSVWKDKPSTMIKKVAESQCLRACFQDLLGGTYGEEETDRESNHDEQKQSKSEKLLDRVKAAKNHTYEAEVVEAEISETGESATKDELEEIHALRAVKVFDSERLKGALEHYKVETLAQLTSVQAKDFINILNKCADKE